MKMETPYIKDEIKKLTLLDSRGYLTENKQLLLAELQRVYAALNIDSVS